MLQVKLMQPPAVNRCVRLGNADTGGLNGEGLPPHSSHMPTALVELRRQDQHIVCVVKTERRNHVILLIRTLRAKADIGAVQVKMRKRVIKS
jgi:hypothetical protein